MGIKKRDSYDLVLGYSAGYSILAFTLIFLIGFSSGLSWARDRGGVTLESLQPEETNPSCVVKIAQELANTSPDAPRNAPMYQRFWRGLPSLLTLGSVYYQIQMLQELVKKGHPVRALDSGGGLSITGIQLAQEYGFETSTVDIKNYYRHLIEIPSRTEDGVILAYDRNRNIRQLSGLPAEALIRLVSALGIPLPEGFSYDSRKREATDEDRAERVIKISGRQTPGEIQKKLKDLYTKITERVDQIPNFHRHRTSLQQFFLANPQAKFHLIIDRYATYYQSFDRNQILRDYYDHLSDNGIAIIRASRDGIEHAERLAEEFPTIFSVERGAMIMRRDWLIRGERIFPRRNREPDRRVETPPRTKLEVPLEGRGQTSAEGVVLEGLE